MTNVWSKLRCVDEAARCGCYIRTCTPSHFQILKYYTLWLFCLLILLFPGLHLYNANIDIRHRPSRVMAQTTCLCSGCAFWGLNNYPEFWGFALRSPQKLWKWLCGYWLGIFKPTWQINHTIYAEKRCNELTWYLISDFGRPGRLGRTPCWKIAKMT